MHQNLDPKMLLLWQIETIKYVIHEATSLKPNFEIMCVRSASCGTKTYILYTDDDVTPSHGQYLHSLKILIYFIYISLQLSAVKIIQIVFYKNLTSRGVESYISRKMKLYLIKEIVYYIRLSFSTKQRRNLIPFLHSILLTLNRCKTYHYPFF